MTARSLRTRLTGVCFAALVALPATAAQAAEGGDSGTASAKENPVVATIDGNEIRFQEVMKATERLPKRYQNRIQQLFPQLLDRLVDMRVVSDKAEAEGFLDKPEVQDRLQRTRQQILADVYLKKQAEDYVTEERLRAEYEEYKKNNKAETQVKARHILVDSKKLANKLIKKLDEGANFVELAKQHSTGPSAKKGGNLGFFGKGDMVESFSKAAFGLGVDEYTESPVKTQYGWHVIKVVDERTKEPKSFEEMKDELSKKLRQQGVKKAIQQVREQSDVETYPDRGVKLLSGGQGGNGQGGAGSSGSGN
ncbi:peptidyl-prolyl cis-trans isomerase C [Limimonas halophila]|uniref:Parvulin-like PPIase n=1 Tax=Limimonas halophila TaxID=1082479 RepID=A0A1G7PXA7_9PROT|nr:peptidylprolyl isomerase [Limimonas halophila]SDF90848.1 peptidyl-prolyl cis-trans isomerase C [Limimonas halophila]